MMNSIHYCNCCTVTKKNSFKIMQSFRCFHNGDSKIAIWKNIDYWNDQKKIVSFEMFYIVWCNKKKSEFRMCRCSIFKKLYSNVLLIIQHKRLVIQNNFIFLWYLGFVTLTKRVSITLSRKNHFCLLSMRTITVVSVTKITWNKALTTEMSICLL